MLTLRLIGIVAALYGLTGVAVGALAAHFVAPRLGEDAARILETAVRYQVLHAIAMLALALAGGGGGVESGARLAGTIFAAGVLLFSGSLYVLAFGGPRWVGPVTPVGGLLFIAGWAVLAVTFYRASS